MSTGFQTRTPPRSWLPWPRSREEGLAAARHMRGEIYEVRAEGQNTAFRVLFAQEGKKGRILLALEGFAKKTKKTPPGLIQLAERRLADWRSRSRSKKSP